MPSYIEVIGPLGQSQELRRCPRCAQYYQAPADDLVSLCYCCETDDVIADRAAARAEELADALLELHEARLSADLERLGWMGC